MNEQDLKANGYYHAPNGEWYKPPARIGLGGLPADKPEPDQRRALEPETSAPKARAKKVERGVGAIIRVHLIRVGGRPFDSDNFIAGYKPLRDAIAARLKLDDEDATIEWEYSQVVTRGKRGTIVILQMIA